MGNVGEWEVKRDTRIGPPPSLPFSTMPSCRLGETNGLHPTMYHMAVQRPGPGDQVAAASSTTLCYRAARPGTGRRGGRLPPPLGAESERGLLCSGPQIEALRLGCSLGPSFGKCRRNVFQLLRELYLHPFTGEKGTRTAFFTEPEREHHQRIPWPCPACATSELEDGAGFKP